MIPLDEYKMQLGQAQEKLREAGASIDPAALREELKTLEAQMGEPDFWNDVDAANKVNQRAKTLQDKLHRYEKLVAQGEDLETLLEMAEEDDDDVFIASDSHMRTPQKRAGATRRTPPSHSKKRVRRPRD